MEPQILSNALFTKTQQRVLGLLFGAPGKSFYTNEIVRIAAVGRGTVTRELVKLAEAGVLTLSAEGNQKHYQANPNCAVYSELLKITRKLFSVEAEVLKPKKPVKVTAKDAQKPVKKKVQEPKTVVKNEAPESEDETTVYEEEQLSFF